LALTEILELKIDDVGMSVDWWLQVNEGPSDRTFSRLWFHHCMLFFDY